MTGRLAAFAGVDQAVLQTLLPAPRFGVVLWPRNTAFGAQARNGYPMGVHTPVPSP